MASSNKELTQRLLYKWKQKKGTLTEEDQNLKPKILNNELSESDNILLKAQQILLEIKRNKPVLTEHVENCYFQIGQIMKLMKR